MKESQFIDDRKLRDSSVNHYEVLERVKELLLIPDIEVMTTEQVANFYEVDYDAVKKIAQRNVDELESDGMKIEKMENFLKGQNVSFQKERNKAILTYENGITFSVTNRGLKVFPRRAILRVGMLLRDSEVAKEVRTQLLNIEEKTSDEVKTLDINEEQQLMLSVGMAVASGDATAVAMASAKLVEFKNRHIEKLRADNEKLETDNKALAGNILEWSDRKAMSAGIRKLACVTHNAFGDMWNELYKNLQYKYGICLKQRGKSPFIQHVKENEWDKVLKTFSAMCEAYGQSPTEMFQQKAPKELVGAEK